MVKKLIKNVFLKEKSRPVGKLTQISLAITLISRQAIEEWINYPSRKLIKLGNESDRNNF